MICSWIHTATSIVVVQRRPVGADADETIEEEDGARAYRRKTAKTRRAHVRVNAKTRRDRVAGHATKTSGRRNVCGELC
jgi:hypothetical protein